MLADEDWQATIVRYAGKGTVVLQHVCEAMAVFDNFLRLKFSLDTTRTKKDYSQSFGGVSKTPQQRSKIEELMETGKRAMEILLKRFFDGVIEGGKDTS